MTRDSKNQIRNNVHTQNHPVTARKSNDELVNTIREIISPKMNEAGLYVENVAVKGNQRQRRVEVYLDLFNGTESLGSSQLEEASRVISDLLDETDPIPGAYTLEVSTLGAEHVLSNRRLMLRAVGQDVEVKSEGKTLTGVLLEVTESELILQVDSQTENIALNTLESAKTVIVFGNNRRN